MILHEILELLPENLDESQKDEVCNEIKWINIDEEDLNFNKLKTLFKMSQEILKYKDEQVDSLMTEFDEIARKQGTEEAKLIQNLENEIKSLRSSSESRLQTPDIDLLKEIENLKSKIKNLKVNLKLQIQETEKLQSTITILQEERILLQSELHQIHDSDSQSEVSEVTDKHQLLSEHLREKNKQISQLLSDIEFVEKENISLKENVIHLRDKLNEATEHIKQMTSEISGQKRVLHENRDKLDKLHEENTALRNQVEDLVHQKNERDVQLDHFSMTLDAKVEELKQVLSEKQTDIKELKYRNFELEKKIFEHENTNKIPLEILLEREEQIVKLQAKLMEATQEIKKTTNVLNKMTTTKKLCTSNDEQDIIIDDLKLQLADSHTRCQELQQQLDCTERDAQNYSEQFAELISRLHKYEEGQYGLSDALREMQDCRLQINIRDKQIAELIQNCNKLQSICDEVEHENLTHREKLGLPLDAPISKNGIISKQRKLKKLIRNLQNQIEVLEDEKLQMKVDLQKYKRSTELETDTKMHLRDEADLASEHNCKKQFTEMAEENEALRKGMHEILESIRAKNESGNREIKSQTLEQLLQIMDVRHVSGWYHPAMRLQAELNTLQGTNAELRNQLQITRSEINISNEESRKAETKIQELQQKIQDLSKSNKNITTIDSSFITSLVVPPNITATSAEIISKLNSHLLIVLNEYNNEVQNTNNLKEKLEASKQEINTIRHQTGLLYKQYIAEKQVLSAEYEEIQSEKHTLIGTIKALQLKLEKCINTTNSAPDVDNIAVKLSSDLISLNRKCLYLEENEKKLISENTKLKTQICDARSATSECIKDLEISRNNLAYKVSILEKALRDTVPKNKLESCTRALYELTGKYRELLQDTDQFKENNNVIQYKRQIELLHVEKEGLFCEILKLKCKTGSSGHFNGETEVLNNKVMTLELNEMKERQRADHVNNLYELIKEQLNRCEERCVEMTNQNKIVLNTNLKLQLAQQELQDKLANSVTHEQLQNVQEKLTSTETEFHSLKNKYDKLLNRNNIIEAEIKTRETFKSSQNMELTNLKHLLLDLQSTSDDKALIARLGTEVVLARICESEAKNKLDILTNELQQTKDEHKYTEMLLEESYMKFNNIQNQFQMKCRLFEQILYSARSQYLGCSPLSSQERQADIMRQMFTDKQTIFTELQSMQRQKNDIVLLQEQLNLEIKNTLELKTTLLQSSCNSTCEKIIEWYKEKNTLQLNELKCRRNLEINELQLEQSLQRLRKQDVQLAHLEEELLKTSNSSLNNTFFTNLLRNSNSVTRKSIDKEIESKETIVEKINTGTDPHCVEPVVLKSSVESQTDRIPPPINNKSDEIIASLQEQIRQANEIISLKDSNLQRQQMSIKELEQSVEILKGKLQESDNRVLVTENIVREPRQQVNVIDEIDLEEHNTLKSMVSKLQVIITQKEDTIAKYEQLLKQGRDEHSLAASRLQEEIKQLQILLQQQQQAYQDLKNVNTEPSSTDLIPNRTAIEQYVSQVHILEGHMSELQTTVSSLNSQLQASRQESVRWRTLANDRLKSIETLRKQFDDQYHEEITTYRDECEKYKEENLTTKQELSKLRLELSQKNSNVNQVIQEKDTKLHELTMTVMQLKNELKLLSDNEQNKASPEYLELELSKQLVDNELEAYKKRFEQISAREKSAREEIRNLRGQLIKRPVLSARSDRGDKVKEQLQKKIASLEKELADVNERLEKETAFNEARRVKITEDFTLWEKQKKWQQAAEKCKEKLNVKNEELEKLQQSYNAAKTIISRLEREKHILEGKLKVAKNSNSSIYTSRLEVLENENSRLKNEVDTLSTKLEMQHYHSGGLGASMLQEKLEAQERKIAILELSAKGTNEVTAELERLNSTVASLKKTNLRLEAENLELGIDLKKVEADTPYLREQIQHLDRYIEALKTERDGHHVVTNAGDQQLPSSNKKMQELEKTILSLKRLVEKLQVENKRLQSRARPCSSTSTDRKFTSDKSQMELKKIREQYAESIERSVQLKDELDKSQKKVRFLENAVQVKHQENESSLRAELSDVMAQLVSKSQLLDKVKILLQKAALKEKYLEDQITQLKDMMTKEDDNINLG